MKKTKKVIYVSHYDACCSDGSKSHETLLKEHAHVATIYLAEIVKYCWGDDWNDAPSCCNSGEPYEETCKGYEKIEVRLGEPLKISK